MAKSAAMSPRLLVLLLAASLTSCDERFSDSDGGPSPFSECEPGTLVCRGDDVHSCTSAGIIGAKVKSCPAGSCVAGKCLDSCSKAASVHSYMGCHYWPTVTINTGLDSDLFPFAVVVANTWDESVDVDVDVVKHNSGRQRVASTKVAPHSSATIKLPWQQDLVHPQPPSPPLNLAQGVSTLSSVGGYRLTSSKPVTVYQFNPLEYQTSVPKGHVCESKSKTPGICFSFSNDASLLLPENALGKEHMVIARPTFATCNYGVCQYKGGFASIVATKKGTTTVTLALTADTHAFDDGYHQAHSKGETVKFQLSQFGVLQLLSKMPEKCSVDPDAKWGYCDMSSRYDLTGTVITASQEVAVFTGHDCAFVPHDKWACDHLEEQMTPLATWGSRYLVAHTASSGKDPSLYRIVSAADGNRISFNPGVHASATVDSGQYLEFASAADFEVRGTGRFAIAQFMVGQNYSTPENERLGDPAMALVVPVGQFRSSYLFGIPDTYKENYVNIIAHRPSGVKLDGVKVEESEFRAIGNSGYKVARIKLAGGSHTADSTAPFGMTVYGVGKHTSYMYPAGLDLRPIK
jgi:hypothetical protein